MSGSLLLSVQQAKNESLFVPFHSATVPGPGRKKASVTENFEFHISYL